MSDVWNYFERGEVGDKFKGRCKKCSKFITSNKGLTSGMRSHITSCWKVVPKIIETPPAIKKTRLDAETPRRSLSELLASLVAVDGFSVNVIAKSDVLHYLFEKEGYNLPKSPTTIMNMIHDYANETKQKVTTEIN